MSEHHRDLDLIVGNMKRMGEIINKMARIERVELQHYAAGTYIVDVDRSLSETGKE